MLFHYCILQAPTAYVKPLLSKNLLRCLANHLSESDRYLNRAAEKARKAILSRSVAEASSSQLLLEAFLASHLIGINFDVRTKTKTVEVLLTQAASANPNACIATLDASIADFTEGDEDDKQLGQNTLTNLIVSVFRVTQNEARCTKHWQTFVRKALELLGRYAYFPFIVDSNTVCNGQESNVSDSTRSLFRSRISSCLLHIIRQDKDAAQIIYTFTRDMNDCSSIANLGEHLLLKYTKSEKHLKHAFEILTEVNRGDSPDERNRSRSRAATLLLSLSILQVYNEEPDAASLLEDIIKIFHAGAERQPTELLAKDSAFLVEVLLTFVSKPSLLLRRTACEVFGSITDLLDEEGLEPMLKVSRVITL